MFNLIWRANLLLTTTQQKCLLITSQVKEKEHLHYLRSLPGKPTHRMERVFLFIEKDFGESTSVEGFACEFRLQSVIVFSLSH